MTEPRASRPQALTVSELNRQVRHLLEVSFLQVWVEGELSGFSRPSSGHWYFTLKDQRAQVRCAMFRGRNQAVREPPKEGDQVLVRAKVSLYEGRGDFQLLVESIEPAGLGALQRAFSELKEKLQAEGLFESARKRPIPQIPRHVGVVTSGTGAAIHDIITVFHRRFPGIPLTLFPTPVQGAGAAAQIVAAIDLANRVSDCDVLIVGRGGGSLEDLWPFNEEIVARAIFTSRIPIVSAVGHEVDFTIADFVADARAPTPSAAAERLSPNRQDYLDSLDRTLERLLGSMRRQLRLRFDQLQVLGTRLRDPRQQLQQRAQRLDELETRLQQSVKNHLSTEQRHLQQISQRLAGQSPARTVGRALTQTEDLSGRLQRIILRRLEHAREHLNLAAQTLNVVSPLATLGRGYAIVLDRQTRIIRDSMTVQVGDPLTARLARGSLQCVVTDRLPELEPDKENINDRD